MKTKNIVPRLLATTLIVLLITANCSAQGVGINTAGLPADSSAILDVSSTTKGVLISRMSSAGRNAINNPAEGLMIFNTDSKCINIYRNGGWFEICGNCIPPVTPVATNNGPMCAGNTLSLTASTIAGVTYSWSGPNGFSSSAQNPQITNVTTSASGTYSLTAAANGCTSNAATTSVTINPLPNPGFSNTAPALSTNITFSPVSTGMTYSWTFQGGTPSTSTAQNPVVIWNATGIYTVSLTVTNGFNCSATGSATISIQNCAPGTITYNYTGNIQYFTVPACVSVITVEAYGAEGGATNGIAAGGKGGKAQATIPVTGGETLNVFVGGMGQSAPVQITGGYNGGGGTNASSDNTGAGGGASDVRRGLTLNDRLIVAGGGGGAGYQPQSYPSNTGGNGGGLTGADGGTASWCTPSCNGKGGTQSAGGAGGQRTGDPNAGDGTFGVGGRGQGSVNGGGGGGGGWYGGGGGEATAGGGGSSYISAPGNTNTSTTAGVNSGNGYIIISW